jgi:beta-glucosidase
VADLPRPTADRLRGAGDGGFVWATGFEATAVAQSRPGQRQIDEYELIDHYEHWRGDVDLAAEIGFDAVRYGIPWYRVQPEPTFFDWSFTDRVIPHIVARGLEPIVDLVHYGTPLWLDGAFLHPDYPRRVAEYATAFAVRYRDLVRCYTPLNEPHVTALICGEAGQWPPYGTDRRTYVAVADAVCRGVLETAAALRAVRFDTVIVHVEGTGYWTSEEGGSVHSDPEEVRVLTTLELLSGRVDGEHPLAAELAADGLSDGELEHFRSNPLQIDTLGLNYYPDGSVHRRATDGSLLPVWGGAHHLARAVRDFHARYGHPIFISESGCNELSASRLEIPTRAEPGDRPTGGEAPPDAPSVLRASWFGEAFDVVARLRRDGVPLVGFTWWPLIDAVSWAYATGTDELDRYIEPGGLVRLQRDSGGRLRRQPLAVAELVREAIGRSRAAQPAA